MKIFSTLYEGPEIFTRSEQLIDDDWPLDLLLAIKIFIVFTLYFVFLIQPIIFGIGFDINLRKFFFDNMIGTTICVFLLFRSMFA